MPLVTICLSKVYKWGDKVNNFVLKYANLLILNHLIRFLGRGYFYCSFYKDNSIKNTLQIFNLS